MVVFIFAIVKTYSYIFLKNHSKSKLTEVKALWEQTIDFDSISISNTTGTVDGSYLVPNHVHFVRFGEPTFTFVHLITVLAAFKNQKPDKIFFHCNHNLTFIGPYWEVLTKLKPFMDIVKFEYVEEPTEIFGQIISPGWRKFHGSDLTRIRVLIKYGGIYLDNDSYVIKSLNDFRKYEMTLNWDENQFLGSQVLLAHKDARFLKLWLESYRNAYRKDLWYYNAGERPTKEILWKRPQLVHRVKVQFGADTKFIHYIFQKQWPEWRNMYAVHLLYSHQYLLKSLSAKATFPVQLNETNIGYYPVTFRDMAYDVYDVGNITWKKEFK